MPNIIHGCLVNLRTDRFQIRTCPLKCPVRRSGLMQPLGKSCLACGLSTKNGDHCPKVLLELWSNQLEITPRLSPDVGSPHISHFPSRVIRNVTGTNLLSNLKGVVLT